MTSIELADLVVEQVRQIAALRAERDSSYRAVAVAGIHHAHDQHVTIVKLERQLAALRDEFRAFRARVDQTRAA